MATLIIFKGSDIHSFLSFRFPTTVSTTEKYDTVKPYKNHEILPPKSPRNSKKKKRKLNSDGNTQMIHRDGKSYRIFYSS